MAEYNAGSVVARMTADGKGYHAAVEGVKKENQSLKQSAQEVKTSYTEMGIAAGASFAAITAGIWKSIDANNQLKAAMIGLDSIAKGTVGSYSKIEDELEKVREDGMIPLNNAIAAYKNLLMRYKDEETAIKMFKQIADAAAFGRQAHLSLGDAIQGTTEGLKNENSQMTDNGGITKNLSVMWKEYAASIGKTVGQLTEAEKRQAEVNGFMEEGKHQVGDLAKLQNELAGELAKASAAGRDVAAVYGDAMEPAVSAVVVAYTGILQGTKELIANNPGLVAGVTAGALAFTGLSTAMAGANALIPKIAAGFKALFVSSGPVGWGIVAITVLTGVIVGLQTAQQKQLEEMQKLSKEYRAQSNEIYDLVDGYKELSSKTEITADEKERLEEVTKRLIQLSPDVVKGYDDEGQAILDLNIALEAMVNKKREALRMDMQLLDSQIKNEERIKDSHERRRRLAESRGQTDLVSVFDTQIEQQQIKIDQLNDKREAIEKALEGTTVEALVAENEARKAETEAKKRAADEAQKALERQRQEEQLAREREKLEVELADRLFELTRQETEVKIRELDKQKKIYEDAKIKEIEVDGQKFTLAQWYDLELTKIKDEEAEKQKQIAEDLAKWQEDWQSRARLALMEEYDQRVAQYELDRQAALGEARKKLENEEQYKQAELAINQYYNALIAQAREEQGKEEQRAFNQRVKDAEEAIQKEYGLEKQLTEWEKRELLERLQAELAALKAMEDASAERIEALKNVIAELSAEIPNISDMTKQWTESLVDGLSRAIVEGESLADVFDNLLRTITQYYLKQAMMGALTGMGFPTFHGGGEVPQRFHWGGLIDPYAGAIKAHAGLKLERDEVPIIAQTGERVLSRAQNAAYEAGMKPEVNIEIVNNTGTPIQTKKEVDFDGPRTVVRLFMEGYARNMEGIQGIMKPR